MIVTMSREAMAPARFIMADIAVRHPKAFTKCEQLS